MKEKLRKYFINPKWIVVFLVVALYCIPQVTSLGYVSLDRISITIG